ncbi:UNVERIFIED_CONTAM: hypothetical protein FKN15_046365 [Acipenser sinensis]
MSGESHETIPQLELESVIGFNGRVPTGLNVHPDGEHLVYPLGCTIIIQALRNRKQEFLHGHTNNVSYVTVSRSGQYIASGQVTFMGFKADIIIWDYSKREIHARLTLHKAKVEALAFSPNDLYLVSLGGQDDGSVVVWNVAKGEAVCGSPASAPSAGNCLAVKFSNNNDAVFITAGNSTLRVWDLDLPNRKIHPTECQTGQLKRIVTCLEVSDDDSFFFCGTSSGDILTVNLKTKLLNSCAPQKKKFSLGVTALKTLKTGDMLVGSGDGVVSLCKGTPFNAINGTSELFATCSKNDIRVWHSDTCKELLRITVPNMTCHAVEFMQDGKSIISGGDDKLVKVWGYNEGEVTHVGIGHSGSITRIKVCPNARSIISISADGAILRWKYPLLS